MEKTTVSLSENGFAAYKKKDFLTASEAFKECLSMFEEKDEKLNAAEMRNNLCVTLLELKKPEEALDAVLNTDLVFAEANDKKRQAIALANIATALAALNRNDEALTTFEQASELFKEVDEKSMRSTTLKKISELQLKTGKQFQALASLEASYENKEKMSFKEKLMHSFMGPLFKKLFH